MVINDQLFKNFKNTLVQNGFTGDVLDDVGNRVVNATDNSIYEVMPLAVVQPQHEQDIQLLCKIANYPEFKSLSFTARGGGTGTNGQSLSSGIIVDTSRYMTKIIEFDPVEKTVTVQSGVVLSQLNQYLAEFDLFFAPHVSTGNRATIGGMIANDSAGTGSLVYGKTNDHVLELSCILIDGSKLDVCSLNQQQLANELSNGTQLGKLSRDILDLLDPFHDEINKKFVPLKRPLSGYNLKEFSSDNRVDLSKILIGSEGTLAFISAAKLKLLPIPKYKALVITHYGSFLDALDNVSFILAHNPLAIETVDEVVQNCASTLPSWSSLSQLIGVFSFENVVSNFTEFTEYDEDLLEDKLNQFENNLQQHNMRYKIIRDANQIKQLWNIRSSAVGLVGRMSGERKPVAFVEDAIVPPQYMRNFVDEFRHMLDGYGVAYAMYGHSDVGCVHVRPALDMKDEGDRSKIRLITDEVIKLTDKYHGLLWGEHGKGYRGEFVQHTFGDVLYPVLQKIKLLFDPENRLNPGKLVTPYNSSSIVTKIDNVVLRGELDKNITAALANWFSESMMCNGNAACFNVDSSNIMCPSYKVTGNRIHSPKGRAMLVKDYLRNKSRFGSTDKNTVMSAHTAFNAMQGCLGCKGCSGKCPTLVSIPDLKAKFYDEYYREYKTLSLREKLLVNLEKILLLGAKFPKLWNFMVRSKIYPSFGMVNTPLMSLTNSLESILIKNDIILYRDDLSIFEKNQNSVVILLDVFIGFLNHQVLIATCNVLKACSYTPIVIYPMVSGKALIISGKLEEFKHIVTHMRLKLAPIFMRNIPVVGLENSITLMYRDEYKKFGDGLTGYVNTIVEFLAKTITTKDFCHKVQDSKNNNVNDVASYYLLPHCTEQAVCPNDAKLWQDVFKQFHLNCKVINLGCCGMAGTYGHEEKNHQLSKKLFAMHWQNELIDKGKLFMATGYSCRSQAKLLLGMELLHPVQVLAEYCIA